MAIDATGTPSTLLSIPKINTAVDSPSGKGINAIVDDLDGKIIPKTLLTTTGDIMYASAANTPARRAIGSTGDVFTVAGGVPTWAAATGLPAGAILQYGAASAPTGYLLCDGAAVSRTTYAALFTITSTLYGVGDGSTTFNLPDFRGRVPAGYAASGGHTDVATLGNNDGVAVANRRAKHKHTVTDPGHAHNQRGGVADNTSPGQNAANGRNDVDASVDSNTTGITVGAATDSLDAPAYLVVNYIIKT